MRDTLKLFTNSSSSLYEASEALLNKLGIQYSPLLRGNSFNDYFEQNDFTFQYVEEVNKCIDQIWNIGYVNDTTFQNTEPSEENAKYFGLSIFACEIKPEAKFPRGSAVVLTRAFNRISTQKVNNAFDMPVIVIMRQGAMLSLATCERSDRKDGNGEKVGKVTILRDMNCKQLHAGHKQILDRIKENVHDCQSFEDLHQKWFESFDIKILSEDFFKKYKSTYEDIVEHITDKRMKNSNSKGVEVDNGNPCKEIMSKFACFDNPEKAVRDYVKKLMGRLVFIQFLQKKGWMGVPAGESWNGGDPEFLQNLFHQSEHKEDFVDKVLAPLFNDLNTRRENDLVSSAEVSLGKHIKVPYLNGGLFEVSDSDNLDFKLPSAFFWNTDEEAAKKNPGILRLFANYNFTIDENAPDNVEVAVDPEMLGRIFENLLEDNKDKGAFYTPKEIVQYMCRESLIAYLQTDVNDDQTKDAIRQFVTTYDVPERLKELKESVSQKLKDVKICDPAIGSGAFPMGLLRELYACRKAIEDIDEETAVSIKKHIIQNNIYGVDIEKGAVDIARLRFWLSLIVDEKNPHALPNMDFKIMLGNSLLEQYEGVELSGMSLNEQAQKKTKRGQAWQQSIAFDEQDSLKNIQNAIRKYYNTDKHGKKVELRDRINSNLKSYIIDLKGCSDDIKQKLKALPIPNDQFFLWHIYFKEVFDKGGFDIVIGNPPYINVQLMSDSEKKLYRRNYTSFFKRCDMFCLFLELGLLKLSADNGIVTLIIPSVVHSNMSYQRIRDIILNRQWLQEVHYTGGDVFNAPTVDTTILICNKGGNKHITLTNAVDFANPVSHQVAPDYFKNYKNVISIGDDQGSEVFNKLFNPKFDVVDHHFNVFQGIVTGNNPAFIFDTEQEALEKNVDITLLHPLCHGRDIEKYKVKSRERRILYIDNGVNIDDYPKTKEWLLNFKEALDKRNEGKHDIISWCSLHRPRVKAELDTKEKIMLQRTRNESLPIRIVATLDNTGVYGMEGINFVFPKHSEDSLRYLLGILNSKLINYLFATKFLNLAIKAEYVKQIRIPTANEEQKTQMENLVNQTLERKQNGRDTSILESEIDLLVYHLYGLTYDEVLIVDPETPITREEYESEM